MSIFGNLFKSRETLAALGGDVDEPEAEGPPESTWPPQGRRLFRVPFLPGPDSVPGHLREAFEPVRAMHQHYDLEADQSPPVTDQLHRKLQFYAVGLEALVFCIPPGEMPPRAGVYREVTEVLAAQLAEVPLMLRHGGVLTYLEILSRELCKHEEATLQELGAGLREATNGALAAAHRPPLDDPEDPGALTREKVFEVLLEECHRDGEISEDEQEAMDGIARILDITPGRQQELAQAAIARYKAGELRRGGEMDPAEYMARLRREAEADGVLEEAEKARLAAIAHFLRVEEE